MFLKGVSTRIMEETKDSFMNIQMQIKYWLKHTKGAVKKREVKRDRKIICRSNLAGKLNTITWILAL